jgi:medium-chain acyl-[acyl-carrier-protein] hydrolase
MNLQGTARCNGGDGLDEASMNALICPEGLMTCQSPNPNARLRVFCFPFAGGGASAFNAWADELPYDVRVQAELCAIQLPGRETNMKVPPYKSISPLLDALAPVIGRDQGMPFAFLGHSMGALISFELARQLRREGRPGPTHMVVAGHRAPQLPKRHSPIHDLPDQEIIASLRVFGGTPEGVLQNSELMDLFLPVLRADFAVCEDYAYASEEALTCSITALGGNDDGRVSHEELSAWRVQTSNSFSMHMFPGDHFFIQSAQVLVLRVLAQDLKQVLRRLPSGM